MIDTVWHAQGTAWLIFRFRCNYLLFLTIYYKKINDLYEILTALENPQQRRQLYENIEVAKVVTKTREVFCIVLNTTHLF